MAQRELDTLRGEIEDLSHDLLKLLNKRGDLACKIGKIKDQLGLEHFDPIREHPVLLQILKDLDLEGAVPQRTPR